MVFFIVIAAVILQIICFIPICYIIDKGKWEQFLIANIAVLLIIQAGCVYITILVLRNNDSPEWSREAEKSMRWSEAAIYCQELDEGGHTDWKLPKTYDLDALRKKKDNYWSSDPTNDIKKENVDEEDKAYFYDFENNRKGKAFVSTNMRVVCARNMPKKAEPETTQDDTVDAACEYARKQTSQPEETWKRYLEDYPGGICAQEAKDALDKIACNQADNLSIGQAKKIEAWKKYLEKFPIGRCVNDANQKICDLTRELNKIENWKTYLSDFPNGQCAQEAKQKICDLTREKNSLHAWKEYLKNFQDGECSFEAKDQIERLSAKYKELQWSKRSINSMNWNDAQQHCKNLDEDGYSDWRLPDIDELRTLLKADRVKNNCQVSERNNCLSMDDCWSCSDCTQTGEESLTHPKNKSSKTEIEDKIEDKKAEKGNKKQYKSIKQKHKRCSNWGTAYSDGRYSILSEGDIWLWSSSTQSDNTNHAWYVRFGNGSVYNNHKSTNYDVRCVR